jgi:hypothetical protein
MPDSNFAPLQYLVAADAPRLIARGLLAGAYQIGRYVGVGPSGASPCGADSPIEFSVAFE